MQYRYHHGKETAANLRSQTLDFPVHARSSRVKYFSNVYEQPPKMK
jgi:hypothetical protein